MNLIQQLDEVAPNWRRTYGTEPMAAAYELGLIDDPDDSYVSDVQEIDLHDESTAWQRYVDGYEDEE